MDKKGIDEVINKAKSFLVSNKRYVFSGVCLIVAAGFLIGSNSNKLGFFYNPNSTKVKNVSEEKKVENKEEPKEEKNELEVCKDKKLIDFIKNYYKALEVGDVKKIRKFVDVLNDTEINNIRSRAKYLESFKVKKIYYKKAPSPDTWMVYACVDMKIKNIKTPAPGIEPYYVKKDTDGFVILNTQNDSKDVLDKVTDENNTDDVRALFDKTNEEFSKSLDKDKDLVNFFKESGLHDSLPDDIKQKEEAAKKKAEKKKKEEAKKKAEAKKKKAEAKKKKKSVKNKDKKSKKKKSNKSKKLSKVSKKIKKGKTIELKDSVRLRKKKSTKSDIVVTAIKGDRVKIIQSYNKSKWVKVELSADGKKYKGYMMKDLIK